LKMAKKEKKDKKAKTVNDPLSGLKLVLRYVFYGVACYATFMVVYFFGPTMQQQIRDAMSDVLVLGESNFDAALARNDEIMVEFYAPWCMHCKRLAPEYDIAAAQLKSDNIQIGKVDCTKHNDLCKKYDVTGYPTLKIFVKGEDEPKAYSGALTADAIVSKMRHEVMSEPIPETQGVNKKIVAKNFNDLVLNSSADVFVKFYAPWCGHCKAMAPAWEEFATNHKDDNSIIIGDFDATANELELETFKENVKGYPSILWIPAGDKTNPVKYTGGRAVEDFEKWLSENRSAGAKDEL